MRTTLTTTAAGAAAAANEDHAGDNGWTPTTFFSTTSPTTAENERTCSFSMAVCSFFHPGHYYLVYVNSVAPASKLKLNHKKFALLSRTCGVYGIVLIRKCPNARHFLLASQHEHRKHSTLLYATQRCYII
jgi:hypothetical protein